MEDFDGITIMPPMRWDAPDAIFSTDSCLDRCGGWSNGEAFTVNFPGWMNKDENIHINEKELMGFIIAIKLWSDKIRNRNVLAYCDNMVSVEVINSGAARNKFTQACLREFVYITAKLNAMVKVVFWPGAEN